MSADRCRDAAESAVLAYQEEQRSGALQAILLLIILVAIYAVARWAYKRVKRFLERRAEAIARQEHDGEGSDK